MIAPIRHDEEPPEFPGPEVPTREFFAPGGGLERGTSGEPFGFEFRPQQSEMAEAVAEAISSNEHLAIEAGTGVGKSFAYLVPLIISAVGRKVQSVVSTYTISLQEQLINKDIPFLKQHMGLDFKAVLVKGRSNYLCLRRLARARKMGGDLFRTNMEEELRQLEEWARLTQEGSSQDMAHQPSPDLWSAVCCEQGNCRGNKCPEYKSCFFMLARAEARTADVLVVNHHLFFSELAIRVQGASFLPSYEFVVMDEAHMMEGVAADHLGLRVSHFAVEHLLRRLYRPESGKGLLAVIRDGESADLVRQLWEVSAAFFRTVRTWAKLDTARPIRAIGTPPDLSTPMTGLLSKLSYQLSELAKDTEDEDLKAELRSAQKRAFSLFQEICNWLTHGLEDNVYWVELEGRRRQVVLHSAAVEVGPALKTVLFGRISSVVMTSATLAVGGRLEYFQKRIGAEDSRALSVGSPFDYARQMRLLLSRSEVNPTDTKNYEGTVTRQVRELVLQSRGRAFVLFTNAAFMRRMAALLEPDFKAEGFECLVQGSGLSRHAMLERFKDHGNAVLFGLDSFWMGVDVRGEALSLVIITRLPFAVPDHPLIEARMNRIRERGGDPFKEYSLPEAVLKFRQGAGRLIRTGSDEGRVAVLDSRMAGKWYGRVFRASLPECPVEWLD